MTARVHTHSGYIWLTSYAGNGALVKLTVEEAERVGLEMFRAARKMKRQA